MGRLLAVAVLATVVAACTAGGPAVVAAPSASPAPSPSAAPSPSPSPSPSPLPPPPDRSALVSRLDQAAVFPDGVTVSVAVVDDLGRPVFDLNGDLPVLPASTAKVPTGAAAFTLFGPEHRLTTTVDAVGEVGPDGVLDGHLELVGAGDPALSQHDYRTLVYMARPHTPIEDLVDGIVEAGITEVRGGVVAAPDLFGDTPEAPGWKDEYLAVLDARRITSLTVDAGLRMTVIEPAPNPVLELLGAEDPTARAVEVFTQLLTDRGVTVGSGDRAAADAPRETVASVEGPRIADHVRFALERSDNHTADTLFRLVGTGTGADDWVQAGETVARMLEDAGVDTTGMSLVDGSGLSREDRISAATQASILQVLRAGEHGELWRDALAVAGEEGTLRRRLRGTVAAGRFVGKSGTLDDVTALAGTVESADGTAVYHVAAMANVPPGMGRFSSVTVIDDLIALLAEDAAGCTRVAPPEDAADDQYLVAGQFVTCP